MRIEGTEKKLFLQLDRKKQERVLEAAIKEFANKGYTSASMNVVVEQADISKGALFKYFGSKKGLFDHIYRMALNQVKDYLRGVRNESRDENFFQRLRRMMITGVNFIDQYPLLAKIYYRLIYTGDSPYRNKILQELHSESLRFIRTLVEQGMERRELRQDLHPQITAFILECILDRFLQARRLEFLDPALKLFQTPQDESERWIEEIIQLLKRGMATQPTSEKGEGKGKG